MKINFKSLLPHGIAVLVFIVFASVYFSPLFTGYNLIQGDIKQFKGMSKEIVDHRVMEDTDPLWTNSMFGGMPAYQISVFHSNNYIKTIDQILKLGMPRAAGILFIAMLGFYILLMCLRVNPWLAIAGAVAFGFSTINILYIGAGHMSKVNAIAYMAPALGGMILAFRGKWLLGSIIFALFLSLNISANHLQMTYYLMFVMVFVAIGEIVRLTMAKESKSLLSIVGALSIGVLLAVLPSMSNIMTTQEYSKYSTRGKTELTIEPDGKKINSSKKSGLATDYILQYNYGEGEILSTIIPNARGERGGLFGNDEGIMELIQERDEQRNLENENKFYEDDNFRNQNRYWGGQSSSSGAFYFGVVIFVLFVLAIVFLNDIIKWPIVLLVILAMSLASNDPGGINDFFIHKFPMYNKFRDSKMILVILQLVLPFMAMLFIDGLFKGKISFHKKQKFFISGGFVLFLLSVLYIAPSVSGDFMTKDENKNFSKVLKEQKNPESQTYIKNLRTEIKEARKYIFKKDVGRAFLFSFLILSLVYVIFLKKPSVYLISGALLFLVSTDNLGVSLRYLNSDQDEDDKRQEAEYISALASQGYLEEEEDLSILDKYENTILTQIPIQLPDLADFSILNQEKESITGFAKIVGQFKKKMSAYYFYEGVTNDKSKQIIADFATLNLNSNYRVLRNGNPFNETQTSYYHKSIGGYHGAKLKRYQELVDFYIQQEYALLSQNSANFGAAVFQYTPILNMLNTKYFILDPSRDALANPLAQGNAWFVSNIITVKNADEEMLAIGDSTLNLENTAVVHQEFKGIKAPVNSDSSASIKLINYGLNKLVYQSTSNTNCPAIFSETYYPEGWNCYIDNKIVTSFRANYVLRGVMVPAGKHKIEWKFEPKSMETGSVLSGMGSALLILSCLIVFFIEIKGNIIDKNEQLH